MATIDSTELADLALKRLQETIKDFDKSEALDGFCDCFAKAIKDDIVATAQFPFLFYRLRTFKFEQGSKVIKGVPPSTIGKALGDFCTNVSENCPGVPELSQNSGKEYVTRQNAEFGESKHYGATFLFLIGVGLANPNEFLNGFVFQAFRRFSPLLKNVLAEIDKVRKVTFKILAEIATDALTVGKNRNKVVSSLGGLFEMGAPQTDTLWKMFRKAPMTSDQVQETESFQRYYICYRFSSIKAYPALVKSFVVFQSPGIPKANPHAIRQHFAIKAFTGLAGGRFRKSSGAVLALGDKIVCFGTRSLLEEREDESQAPFTGAKALMIHQACFDEGGDILTGGLLVTNSEREIVHANVLLLETTKNEHANAGINVLKADDLIEDIEQHTIFQSHAGIKSKSAVTPAKIRDCILDMMKTCYPESPEWQFNGEGTPPVVISHSSYTNRFREYFQAVDAEN